MGVMQSYTQPYHTRTVWSSLAEANMNGFAGFQLTAA
jgi:hypothetical protein